MSPSYRSVRNRVGFGLRRRIAWRRDGYQEPCEPKDNLYAGRSNEAELLSRERGLVQRYALEDFRARSSSQRYLETLTMLDFLETLLPDASVLQSISPLRWLDAGAKNWSYVEGLYRFAARQRPDFHIHGIELDAFRVYADLHSRFDYAHAYIQDLPKASYEAGDLCNHRQLYSVISYFLPFVFLDPCLAWGLPQTCFTPEYQFRHLLSLLQPGGVLLVLNQGEEEATEQARLLETLDPKGELLHYLERGPMPDSFMPYKIKRYGWTCQRNSL